VIGCSALSGDEESEKDSNDEPSTDRRVKLP
jgi:hypothetical protein